MTLRELENNLDTALSDFVTEIKFRFPEDSSEPATINDVHWAARSAFYTLSEFKDKIIAYLKQK